MGEHMTLSPETNDIARSLLAYEAAGSTSEAVQSLAVRVCEKLRGPLCALAGVVWYRTLIGRALTLARSQTNSLGDFQIAENGSLQDVGKSSLQSDRHYASEADVLLTSHSIGLILSLLGTAVTLQLVQDVFPNLTITTESGTIRQFEDILKEVGYLNSVSDRLELLAGQHPSVEEALMSVSGSVRNTATVLEVLAVIKKAEEDEPETKTAKQERERYMN
jgi:hypothetical protein